MNLCQFDHGPFQVEKKTETKYQRYELQAKIDNITNPEAYTALPFAVASSKAVANERRANERQN